MIMFFQYILVNHLPALAGRLTSNQSLISFHYLLVGRPTGATEQDVKLDR
jgi:hypothetical protein